MAIQTNFPAIKPTLLLDFANTEQLDSRITFTRASTATYYGTETAKAEENLLTFSQELDNAAWSKGSTSVTANTEVAPDGTTTAETLTATASTNFHVVNQTSASIAGTTRTFSVFAKKGTHTFVQLYFNADITVFANFDLDAGTVGTVGSASTATITSVGSDWYRCVMTTSSVSANNVAVIAMITSGTAVRAESWTAAGTETIILWGAQLEQRSAVTAYTPTTDQPITNYIPVLQTAASGVARFDHNPTTFESLALLFEEQRTNLLTYSEQFDNAAWTKVRLGNTPDTIIAPDGTLTGYKIFLDSTNSTNHVAGKTVTVTSGTMYTWSVYLKAGELTEVNLRFSAQFPVGSAFFNLSTGVITNIGGVSISSMTLVGNGWYRCSITQTASSTGLAQPQVFLAQSGSITIATGDGYSGVYIWGAQLEAGDFATSYIPTVASQVTRAADAGDMTGTNFSSWYNQAEGTMYAEASVIGATADAVIASANSGNTNNDIRLRVLSSSNSLGFRVFADGVSQAALSKTNAFTVGQEFKSVGVYKVNDFAFSANGLPVTTDTTGVLGVVTQFQLGAVGAVSVLNGHIRKIAYYPIRLTNTQLQALTS